MTTKKEAERLLKKWMVEKHPEVRKFHLAASTVSLTDYGFVSCWWNTRAGRCAVEWSDPYRTRTIRARKR